ncbi:hypothetical protein [Thalassobacillus devorans]|uniref:hypothetical protein n=1 Tax=Thalassobacillus devorans TaxID=279813 RepID=UPI000A1CDD62|nr:hypothetical protein [Thalassobacillus devorans]
MYKYKLYSTDDIERLKHQLMVYEQTLNVVKKGEAVDDYLLIKHEFNETHSKLIRLEGEMKSMEDKYQRQLANFEEREENFADYMQNVNNMMSQLKEDISKVIDKVDQLNINELIEKINTVIYSQNSHFRESIREIDRLKDDIAQIQDQVVINQENNQKAHNPRKSEYRQLQNMLQSYRNVEQLSQSFSRQNSSFTRTSSQKHQSNIPSTGGQNTLSRGKSKRRTFQQSQNELNKNIIYSKQQGKKKANQSSRTQEKQRSAVNQTENTSTETQCKLSKQKQAQKSQDSSENPNKNNELNSIHVDPKAISPKKNDTTEQEMKLSDKKQTQTETNEETQPKSQKKIEFSSLFSIFQKKD